MKLCPPRIGAPGSGVEEICERLRIEFATQLIAAEARAVARTEARTVAEATEPRAVAEAAEVRRG